MASNTINVIAVLHPKKGKTAQVVALLQEHSEYVKANEPGTLQYEIHSNLRPAEDGTEDVVMVEKYKDTKALKVHGADGKFKAFQKKLAEQDLIRAPMILKVVSEKGGFPSRL